MRHAFSQTAIVAMLALPAFAAGETAAGTAGIRVRILDRDGAPVPEVVVSARPLDAAPEPREPASGARMNQQELAFEPHILVVETGSGIAFPNEDDVRHHVYSFSPAKQFNFSIDSGATHEAIRFDVPGVVTLGCNIHDDMLAYIVVVDTPHFAKTGVDGSVEIAGLEPGRYELSVWSSRVAQKHLPRSVEIAVAAGEIANREYAFIERLHPPHRHSETSLHWSHY
jgi:plastocyanin